jgi:hypothetical protein
MDRVGYNLPELGTPAHMPGWARDLTVATQKVMDDQYLHGPGGLDNFYDQAEAWITTQTMKRGSNRSYAPEPFPMAIPRRQVVGYDADGNMNSYWAAVDPNVRMPELPALVEQGPAGTAFTMATPPDQVVAQMIAAVMAKLVAIEQRLIAALGKA